MSSRKTYQLTKSYRSRISHRSCFLAASPYLWPHKKAVLSPLLSLCPCYFLHLNNTVSYMAGHLLIVFWGPTLGSSQISQVDIFLYGTTPTLNFYLVLTVFYVLLFSYLSFFPWEWPVQDTSMMKVRMRGEQIWIWWCWPEAAGPGAEAYSD